MQIPGNPFPTGPDFLRRPQPAARQQAGAERPSKAAAPGQTRAKTAAATLQAAALPREPGGALARARTLEQAVRTLADEGRLPPRGSLVDLSA